MKVFVSGNYLIVEEENGSQREDVKSDVRVNKTEDNYTLYSPRIGVVNIDPEDVEDENGDLMTENQWVNFYRSNTGFNSAAGGSAAELTRGQLLIVLDGSKTVFLIPHGATQLPGSIGLTFSDTRNDDFIKSTRTFNETNIIITCDNAPEGESVTVNFQTFQ